MPSVIFSRKPVNLEELAITEVQIAETLEISQDEYDYFAANMLADHEWLQGKGGYIGDKRQVVELKAPDRITLYVDPQGSNYGRYVGLAVL